MDHVAPVPMMPSLILPVAPITLPMLVVLIAGVVAGWIDALNYKVHNVVTLPLLVTGLLYHALSGGLAGLGSSAAGAAIGFGLLILPFCLGGIGGGDVKLVAGIGAWLGFSSTYGYVLIASSLAAGLYSLVLIVVRGDMRRTATNLKIILFQIRTLASHLAPEEPLERIVRAGDRRKRIIPLAVMLAVGIVSVIVGRWVL